MRKVVGILPAMLLGLVVSAHSAEKPPLKVCLVSGSEEYKSDESLTEYKEYLEKNHNVRCTLLKAIGFEQLSGLEALDDCDVALFFTRRLQITGDQLERVRKYCTSGKPIVACRTASHGFQNWLEFDKLVLGGNYGKHLAKDVPYTTRINPDAKDHPVLRGVDPIPTTGSLYRNRPIADYATLLMTGETAMSGGAEPVAWARVHNGGRVFYTSLGTPEDFRNPPFQKMMANALFWTARREVEVKK